MSNQHDEQHDNVNETHVERSDISYISRRTFLRWSARLASSMVALSGIRFIRAPGVRAASQSGSYGSGPYGEGTYRGRSGYAIYLPIVERKEN